MATGLIALAACLGPRPALAADANETLRMRSLASTCAHCHGTNGRSVDGEAMPRLAGQSRDFLLTQLLAFRTGARPATIMHQITRGYSQEQLEALATYFANVK
jgi:cytochrome c553